LRQLNSQLFAAQLRHVIRWARIDTVVGTYVAPPPTARRVVFDVFDDNVGYARTYARSKALADEIADAERSYLCRADAVVAASSVLADRLRGRAYTGPLATIPNGVHLDAFSPTLGQQVRARLGLSRSVIGLIGNHDRWPELEKLLEIAGRLADTSATFLVVGRGHALPRAIAIARRRGLNNIRFVGFVTPTDVGAYFSAVDVGLCPYARNPAADAASPLRLLSYSAAGCAVVCTRLEEVRRMAFPNVILADDTAEDIARGVREALGRPRERPPQIAEYDIRALASQYEHVLAGNHV
jgi:hypothetical protein